MRTNMEDNRLRNPIIESGFLLKTATLAPATGAAISADSAPVLILNPAGAVNILLPASTPDRAGLTFIVHNPSASTITFQTSGGAGFTTAITVATLKSAILTCTGSGTAALGWRALAGA